MIRPRRSNGNKPPPQGNKPRPPSVPRGTVAVYKCGHTKPVAKFVVENCPHCRAKLRQDKRDRNGNRKPAKLAMSAFRFPPGTEIKNLTFNGTLWTAILRVPLRDGIGWNCPVEATGYEKLGVAAKDAWLEHLAQKNART